MWLFFALFLWFLLLFFSIFIGYWFVFVSGVQLKEPGDDMKGKRYTIEEKVRILRKADEGGRTIQEVCREANISEVTFHRWKRELGMVDLDQTKRLKELEKENARLKRIVADQTIGIEILKETLEKKL